MILKGGTVLNGEFTLEKCDVEIRDGKISAITESSVGSDILDCTDCYIVPGLIDVHTHGCLGYDYTVASEEEIEKMRGYLLSHGVTSFLPTLLTSPNDRYLDAVERIASVGDGSSKILGIHLEGPCFSERHKGAQNGEFMQSPVNFDFEGINEKAKGTVRIISLAPETEGATDFIKRVSENTRVALGHTAADYSTAKEAFLAGATQLTHTFNGMPPFHHREPSVIGAAFENEKVLCECICDGFHLHPATVRLLFSSVGADRVLLISDSIAAAGMCDCEFSMGGLPTVVKDGKAYLADGKTIAGSTATVYDCVLRAIEFGIPMEDAFKAATLNAAISAGACEHVGSIEVGKSADMLVLNKDYSIKYVILDGEVCK